MTSLDAIDYPYMPPNGIIGYVPNTNPYMQQAKAYAQQNSLDTTMPNASIIVKDGQVIGRAANGSTYHQEHGCERVRLHIPTGQGYELCEGCSPKNHSEPKAIADALANKTDPRGADLYLWGHWWCCQPCWNNMIAVGIAKVVLLQDSQHLFNKKSPNNIIGKQFA